MGSTEGIQRKSNKCGVKWGYFEFIKNVYEIGVKKPSAI